MFLSIIIPVYNVERYIKECLDSVIPQIENKADIEVIIVNDGTRDNSMCIVNNYLSSNANIRIINQENQGLSQARNHGLEASSADYVWFVDSDDYLKEGAIGHLVGVIKSHVDVDVFASYMDRYIEKTGEYVKRNYTGTKDWSGGDYLRKRLPWSPCQRCIYKRSLLADNNIRFIPGILHEDGPWGSMTIYSAKKIYFLSDSIYVYRIRNSGSIMTSIKIKSAYDLITGHQKLMDFLRQNVDDDEYFFFRKFIFCQISVLFSYCKALYNTDDFKEFYNLNYDYIVNEARWLLLHGCLNIFILIISISPKVLMAMMRTSYFVKKILK